MNGCCRSSASKAALQQFGAAWPRCARIIIEHAGSMISGKSSETARSRSALCLLRRFRGCPPPAQYELAAVCVVAYPMCVQPVRDSAPRASNRLVNLRSRGARGLHSRSPDRKSLRRSSWFALVTWCGTASQSRPQNRFNRLIRTTDLNNLTISARRERLTDAVSRRNPIVPVCPLR